LAAVSTSEPRAALVSRTDPAWTRRALAALDEVLLDHAHCEKKAASSAVSLLFKYAERPGLLAPLSRLAREELLHFEQVLGHLARRRVPFRHQVPSPYAGELRRIVRPEEPTCLLDTLLCMALIEARSCERLGLLADALDDPALADFYRALVASEARHHRTYVELAARVAPGAEVAARLAAIARHEAAVLAAVSPMPRLHA
jgi:tRNA-(ms[2]io[6]A)-hydroxylase